MILITPGCALAFLLALRSGYRTQTTLAWIALVNSTLLIFGYCMLVFDERYILPLAPFLVRTVAGALFAISVTFFTFFWTSPFRSLRRDYQTSVYSAAAALRQIPSCNRLVAIGEGPFPMHGVGWEAGIYASYFAQCHVVGFREKIPGAENAPDVLADLQILQPDSILLFGRPHNLNYELLLRTIRGKGGYSTSWPLADQEAGEIGRLLLKP